MRWISHYAVLSFKDSELGSCDSSAQFFSSMDNLESFELIEPMAGVDELVGVEIYESLIELND